MPNPSISESRLLRSVWVDARSPTSSPCLPPLLPATVSQSILTTAVSHLFLNINSNFFEKLNSVQTTDMLLSQWTGKLLPRHLCQSSQYYGVPRSCSCWASWSSGWPLAVLTSATFTPGLSKLSSVTVSLSFTRVMFDWDEADYTKLSTLSSLLSSISSLLLLPFLR